LGIEATVFVVDDDVHGRERIHDLIATVGLSVESYPNAHDFLSTYDGSRFGCLLLDVRLPDMSGLDLQKRLIRNELAPPIIMLSKYGDVSTAVAAMKAGAIDFFEKPFNDQVLLDRVHEAIALDAQQRRDYAFRLKLEAHFALLTPREREVMELVVSGCPNKIIAANLQLSQKTVEAHRAQVMKKSRANSLAELVRNDHQRFRKIVKGKIRKDLRKFLTRSELLGREGKRYISIPVAGVDLPRFRYGDNNDAGVGKGDGKAGDKVDGEGGMGPGGDQEGQHLLEVDVTLDELAEILGEELQLPRIQPKGKHRISSLRDRYTGVRQSGPESLRHFKRTFRRALRRQIMSGLYNPEAPRIIFERRDKIYRSWKTILKPQSNAVIIYMMDVSGSMGDEQKELVRLEAFWIDAWLRKNYQGIESRYIVHDVRAGEVDRETFFRIREDGGTRISSAFRIARDLMDKNYAPDEWNIYLFHFSDGDNSSESDSRECCAMLTEHLLPRVNMFGYCQVASAYGSGNFINVLHEHLSDQEAVITSRVNNKDDIYDSIKTFFAPGR